MSALQPILRRQEHARILFNTEREGCNVTSKEPTSTRLNSDTKRLVDDYRRDRDISESEAVRALVEEGLVSEGYTESAPGTTGGMREQLDELDDSLTSIRRSIAGVFIAVVYTAVALLAPRFIESTTLVNSALTGVGILLIVVLSVTDVINITDAGDLLSRSEPDTPENTDG